MNREKIMSNSARKTLYFAIDDSGKIDDKNPYCVYGGILFLNDGNRSKFIARYKHIIDEIKCNYCSKQVDECDNECPEIKSFIIEGSDRKRLMNLIKKEYCFLAIIDKRHMTKLDTHNKKDKTRFLNYSVKMVVKSVIRELIKLSVVNPDESISIVINIDNENTSTSHIYDLRNSIQKELSFGMTKGNYYYPAILKGKTNVKVNYQDSKGNYDIQAADILSGTLRRFLIHNDFQFAMYQINKIANTVEIIPKKRGS